MRRTRACPDPTVLCFPNLDGTLSNLITTTGQNGPEHRRCLATSILGEIDRTWTTTNSFGGSVQAASSEKLFGHDNNFTIGLSVDRGLVQFSTTSELGTVNANQFPIVQGFGLFIDQPSGDVAPVGLGATTLYTGLYATDTLRRHARGLSLTAGARFNFAQITLTDELGNDSVAQWQPQLQPFQSDDRRDLQDHAESHVLRRFRGRKPRADAARARLLRSRCGPA